MIVSIIKDGLIDNIILPSNISGNFWISDKFGDQTRNLINVEVRDGKWLAKSNYDTKILLNSVITDTAYLELYNFYQLNVTGDDTKILIYCSPIYDQDFTTYQVAENAEMQIGTDSSSQIIYNHEWVAANHVGLKNKTEGWELIPTENDVYLNGKLVKGLTKLNFGDVIFIMGLKLIVMANSLLINNPGKRPIIAEDVLKIMDKFTLDITDDAESNVDLYSEGDFFLKAPRFKSVIEPVKMVLDPPPSKENQSQMPLIYTVGPMLTMGLTSGVMGFVAISNVLGGRQTWGNAAPALVISGAMLTSMILWPLLSKGYEKRQRIKREKDRVLKYRKYLDRVKTSLATTIKVQQQILIENNVSLEECESIVLNHKRMLWEREIDQADFLNVRLGIGSMPAAIELKTPEMHFTVDEDDLLMEAQGIVKVAHDIENVPVSLNLTERKITAIIGEKTLTRKFIESLILQLVTFHSYEDVKIVLLTNQDRASNFDYLKLLPHSFNNDKTIRLTATTPDDLKTVSAYLENDLNNRLYSEEGIENNRDYHNYRPYYIVIVDDLKAVRNLGIFNSLLNLKINKGFSLIIKNDSLTSLPNECDTFINLNGENGSDSGLFENELVANRQHKFAADLNLNINLEKVAKKLANIPVKMSKAQNELPKVLSFLQMYNVGNVEQLNPLNRWRGNNPIASLQAPVGVDENGDLFKLDLHEKFHGPHGLVAGMTGSGKSEFIITYILSLAVNYHPHEVSFVLIDYKGGGLAGAFLNKETGVKLPHLAGTITNLDTVEMKRSLASIQSELKRRQRMFNEAREALNESTIDIYKYQRFYRAGKIKEPISHLFIISDEFAELKSQQPEFMEQLISTARIGRSLGVHLILATQKPSGVVNEQIWSNSKFKICLKVQDKADSMDMIRTAEAASLKDVGRFYLQVGYNEFFAMGQSAWCGAPYFPTEKPKKKRDNSINIINDIGYVLRSSETDSKQETVQAQGEELAAIVKYLSDLAKQEGVETEQLWLDAMNEEVKVSDLESKYNYKAEPYKINPVLGELDDPSRQRQDLLTLNLSEDGNAIIYGVAGSGEELALNTLVYSTIMQHSSNEINFYLIDCGSEMLRAFKLAPQVGDVVTISDQEKIHNLFKMLDKEISKRKKLFADYNGDYQYFIKNSDTKLPTIVVMINNYDAFYETYEDYEDRIMQLTREGIKYGVIFIITATGPASVRYRLSQNFKIQLVMQMNDISDYTTILGTTNGTYPAKVVGRGLVKQDMVYEFQCAFATDKDSLIDYIKKTCQEMNEKASEKAISIPILPDAVTIQTIEDSISTYNNVPIGFNKDNLQPELISLTKNPINIITAQDIDFIKPFVVPFFKILSRVNGGALFVLDTEGIIAENEAEGYRYFTSNLMNVIHEFNAYLDKIIANQTNGEMTKQVNDVVLVIIGFNKFMGELVFEEKEIFISMVKKLAHTNKNRIILVDSTLRLKEFAYEDWARGLFDNSNGIYIGSGISDQSLLSLSKVAPQNELPPGYGYSVKRGVPHLVKLVSDEVDNG